MEPSKISQHVVEWRWGAFSNSFRGFSGHLARDQATTLRESKGFNSSKHLTICSPVSVNRPPMPVLFTLLSCAPSHVMIPTRNMWLGPSSALIGMFKDGFRARIRKNFFKRFFFTLCLLQTTNVSILTNGFKSCRENRFCRWTEEKYYFLDEFCSKSMISPCKPDFFDRPDYVSSDIYFMLDKPTVLIWPSVCHFSSVKAAAAAKKARTFGLRCFRRVPKLKVTMILLSLGNEPQTLNTVTVLAFLLSYCWDPTVVDN